MSDLDWLKTANQQWQRSAEIATARAESAERFLAAETTERKRIAVSRRLWRRVAISAYTCLGACVGVVEWHWNHWVYVACGLVSCAVWFSVEEFEARRAKRKAGPA